MIQRPPRTVPAPSNRFLGAVPALVLGTFLLAGAAPARATSGAGIHIPTVTNFCGAEEVVLEVTICNESSSGQFYSMNFEDSSVIDGCDEAIVPVHEFLDPNPIYVAMGDCEVVSVKITRPTELSSVQTVCYWLKTTPDEQGGVTWLGASLIDRPVACVDWYFEESAHFLHPLVPVEIGPIVTNYGNEPLQMFYIFEARNEFGERDFEVLSLDGQEPGEWSFGNLEVAEGGNVPLSLEVEWTVPGAQGYYDIVMMDESTFEVIGSIGLHLIVETPSDVGDSAGEEGVAGDPRSGGVLRQVSANPSRGGAVVQFERPASSAGHDVSVTARVFDTHGRRVRELFRDRTFQDTQFRFAWDGRDDLGRTVGSGTYWIELSTANGRWTQKLTQVR